MAATLVVCIASPLSENETTPNTPVVLFSYAVALLGRISHALQGTVDRDFLLTFLLYHTNIKWKSQDLMAEVDSNGTNEEVMLSIIKLISKSIGNAWSLIKRSNGNDAERILRYFYFFFISLLDTTNLLPNLDRKYNKTKQEANQKKGENEKTKSV